MNYTYTISLLLLSCSLHSMQTMAPSAFSDRRIFDVVTMRSPQECLQHIMGNFFSMLAEQDQQEQTAYAMVVLQDIAALQLPPRIDHVRDNTHIHHVRNMQEIAEAIALANVRSTN